jgi:hypothetical protein
LDTQYTVYCIFFVILTTLLFHAQEIEFNKWTIDECWHSDNGLHMVTALRNGTALAISDGSHKHNRGTSAFLLQCPLKERFRILGVNRTPGAPDDQSAYRAELSGTSGILALLSLLCQIHEIHEGSIRIGLDGDSAMKEASGFHPLSARSCPLTF